MSDYSTLLTASDIVAFLMQEVKTLQNNLTDINVKECVVSFVEKNGFNKKKDIKENVAELLSYMAYKRHYDDRH